MKLTKNDIETLKKVLKQFYAPDGPERVGFIGKKNSIIEVKNVSQKPEDGFLVAPEDTIKCIEKGAWASWHTHPGQDSNLSGEDHKMFMNWPYMTHFIIGSDKVKAYYYDSTKKAILEA